LEICVDKKSNLKEIIKPLEEIERIEENLDEDI